MNILVRLLTGHDEQADTGADGYRAFTRKFDIIVDAKHLDSVLGLSEASAAELAWRDLQTSMSGWITKLHVQAMERAGRIRRILSEQARRDIVATILIDQSGSMRGQKMLAAAASADVAQAFLRELGIAVEVLGFTTVRWKGGKSRRLWKLVGRPRNPGRLCDLLHVIYRSGDDTRTSAGGWEVGQMLRPNLPKENVDGEAVEWAISRLRSRFEHRKILVVVSDGAPVDDSTLSANPHGLLQRHLEQVIENLKKVGDISLCAVTIGVSTRCCYPMTMRAETPDEIGGVLLASLERALTTADK